MTIVHTLDVLTDWVQKNICDPVTFKVPPDYQKIDNECDLTRMKSKKPDGAGYEYERMTPVAFKWLVPSKDRLPPNIKASFPSVCVRIGDGKDEFTTRTMNIELCLSIWNPGTHGSDILIPKDNDLCLQWTGNEAKAYFERNNEGWRDVWNWVDTALRALESAESLDGIKLDRSSITFAPFKEEDALVDFYPFWFALISFTINRPVIRNVPEWDDLL